jgi:2-oxoglutarate ferredoxin oxidoreductase subunit gamma
MQHEFVFSGFGGQGVMFTGQLLAYAGLEEGLNVTWIPSYGPEMRGGTAHCFTTLSDQAIGSPVVKNPKIGIMFNQPSLEKYASLIASDGLLVINQSMITDHCEREDITRIDIPATDMAYEIGEARVANMILLGAALAIYPVITLLSLKYTLTNHIPAHHKDKLEMNFEAIERGAAYAKQHVHYQSAPSK